MENNRYSQEIGVFHNRTAPEPGKLVGYGALIAAYDLNVPPPDKIALVPVRSSTASRIIL